MSDADTRQRQAADPRASTWLSANAGSGKTRVLTNRVARLLLDGVDPRNILCLTYTKAAASEMQNRLFGRLGSWAMLEDEALRAELATLGHPGPFDLEQARTLFARAIETPGGLRLQTIHAFCASILRRFPLEAGVSPAFAEIDETAQGALFGRLLDEIADGPEAAVIDGLADQPGGDPMTIARDVAARRESFAAPLTEAAARALFGVPPGETAATIAADVFAPGTRELLERVADACRQGSKKDIEACDKLADLHLAAPALEDLVALEPVLLNSTGENAFQPKLGKFPTKATRAALGPDVDALDALMQRVADARPRRLALAAAERAAALHAFAAAFLPRYEAAKAAAGWVDYDDLILKVRRLLADPAIADWVLYRLDGGIDHILVDEAQDTSPGQWQVIERLAAEFAAGRGARDDRPRTLFVVGDRKQSIYSFQGAEPEAFDRMAAGFGARLGGLARLELVHSFRSSRAILETVDRVAGGLPGLGTTIRHEPFRAGLPGRVDLWPIVTHPERLAPGDWSRPVDLAPQNAAHVVLAGHLAEWLKRAIGREPIPDGEDALRPLRAGNVLILVQRRNEMFHEIIRALKAAGLPVAGADRMVLTRELAVRDVLALASFLALPEDDLALATALRSPLFGWTEAQLFDLAHGRGDSFLWTALRVREDHRETRRILWDLLDSADFLRPYDLFERILVRHGGRGRLLARLGLEAEDGIDQLLNKALDYERTEVPSLTGFLSWIAAGDVEVKRQSDAAGDRIRVMTVHGAKGLEADMVILPDTLRPEARLLDQIVRTDDGAPLWKVRRAEETPLLAAARIRRETAENEERNRLLYVAMTRARSWLVVCGIGDPNRSGGTWHDLVGRALEDAAAHAFPPGEGRRLERGEWTRPAEPAPADVARPAAAVPDTPAPPLPPRVEALRASALGGAKALPGDEGLDEAAAMARGTALHLLLEHLPGRPPEARAALAERLLGAPAPDLLAEAEAVLAAPALAPLFAPGALVEVDVAASLPALDGLPLRGTIDRLIVAPDRVLCVDFKSNRTVPATPAQVPAGILRQMGAYAAALAQVYPGRRIETAILWTRDATLMPLPEALTASALLDARGARP